MKVSSCIFATGKGLWFLGTTPSFKFRCTGFVWNSPKVPSKKSSNCNNNFRISSCLSLGRWQQCFLYYFDKLAFSYDAFKIWEIISVACCTVLYYVANWKIACNSFLLFLLDLVLIMGILTPSYLTSWYSKSMTILRVYSRSLPIIMS